MSAPLAVIHVVDDDAAFRTAISRLLKASRYHVVVHTSANEFFEMPPGTDRGCILLDVKMPGVDGLEVQNRLSNLGSNLPIVFLTGYGDIATSVQAIKAGAEDFLSKPVAKKQLLDAIGRALVRYDEAHERNSRLDVLRSSWPPLRLGSGRSLPWWFVVSSTNRLPMNLELRSELLKPTAIA